MGEGGGGASGGVTALQLGLGGAAAAAADPLWEALAAFKFGVREREGSSSLRPLPSSESCPNHETPNTRNAALKCELAFKPISSLRG